ncbi:PiggyBac transposable element-derived protein 4 [Eumeta japonica]|uniref:PiggyBac transposable element-derived protein 4 n=1 Tax=Eumeta variegata TaxID=151549 RepID=A0A4C1VGZ0_EUMVA|nr:PiggyBac transposable element-derived protein 4 [Eumeta japonica]
MGNDDHLLFDGSQTRLPFEYAIKKPDNFITYTPAHLATSNLITSRGAAGDGRWSIVVGRWTLLTLLGTEQITIVMAGFLDEDQIAQLLEDGDDESDPETVCETTTAAVCDNEEISNCEELEVASCSEKSVLETDSDSGSSSSSSEEEEDRQTSGFYRETREDRKKLDRPALISGIFNKFIENSQKYYSCSEYLTVDETLYPFRGRCSFRTYMKSKPAKRGIKILYLCDAKRRYLYNAFIYTGKAETNRRDTLFIPTQTVLTLAEPVMKTNRNITGDNRFSSIALVDKLKENGLTYVGKVQKNKRELPSEFLPHKNRGIGSTLFGFTNDKTLASFVPKKNQSVVMISTMHHDKTIDRNSDLKKRIENFLEDVHEDELDQQQNVPTDDSEINNRKSVTYVIAKRA